MKILRIQTCFFVVALVLSASAVNATETGNLESATEYYSPAGGTAVFDISFDYTGQSLSTMGLDISLPGGWSFVSASGNGRPPIVPDSGTTGSAEFAYFSIPADSIRFSITLNYAAGLSGSQEIAGKVIYKISGNSTTRQEALGPISLQEAVAPAFGTHPESAKVDQGDAVSFSASVTGTPTPTLQWQKNGIDVSGATSSTYQIPVVSALDAGDYTLIALNSLGSVTSETASLTVNVPPAIITQPESKTLLEGANTSFTVSAAGTGPLVYQWRKDNVDVPGANSATLSLSNVQSNDAGSYDVMVSNAVGTITSVAANLVVSSLPVISMQPEGGVFKSGDSLTLAVQASGAGPISYQWRKDGNVIPGATEATIQLNSLLLDEAGSYDVVVSNLGGAVTSDVAVVTVVELAGTHAYAGKGYNAGRTLTVNNTLTYAGDLGSFGWSVMPPSSISDQPWTFGESGGSAGQVAPNAGDTDLFEWAWTSIPASPVEFSYTLNVPANAAGDQSLTAVLRARIAGKEVSVMVNPDPLSVPVAPSTHDADTNQDSQISLSELLRVIEIYNTREGTKRTGVYHPDAQTTDGFAPGRED